MPSSSNFIGTAVIELTASTMNITSGYFFFSAAISVKRTHHAGRGFVVDQCQRVELAGREFLIDCPPREWASPMAPAALRLPCRIAWRHQAICPKTRRTCS